MEGGKQPVNLSVASSPHIRGTVHTRRLMLDVVLALLPALAVGVWVMGLRALWIADCTGAV